MGSGASATSPPALHTAAAAGDAEQVQDPYESAKGISSGRTALHFAAAPGVARALLRALADVNAVADDGMRPLHSSVVSGRRHVLGLLIAAAADVHARLAPRRRLEVYLERPSIHQVWGFRWEQKALKAQRRVVEAVLPQTPAGDWNIAQAASGREALQEGAELLQLDDLGGCDATQALRGARKAKFLFAQGPDEGDAAVHMAIREGQTHLLQPLLRARADARALGASGETAESSVARNLGGAGLDHAEDYMQAGAPWYSSTYSFNLLIASHAKGSSWRYLEDEYGAKEKPNAFTCSAAVKSCEELGQWQHGLWLLHLMAARAALVNAVSLNSSISVLAVEMLGNVTDVIGFSAGIAACEQWQGTLGLLLDMAASRVDATATALSAAFALCERAGQRLIALKLLDELQSSPVSGLMDVLFRHVAAEGLQSFKEKWRLAPTSPAFRTEVACEVEELLPPYDASRALEESSKAPNVEEAVEAAVSPGGLLEAPDALGRRPLHQAAEAGRADLVKRLLDSRADADATTADRDIYLSLTRAPGDETWGFQFDAYQVNLVFRLRAGPTALVLACAQGDELLEVNGRRESTAKSDLRRWHQVNLVIKALGLFRVLGCDANLSYAEGGSFSVQWPRESGTGHAEAILQLQLGRLLHVRHHAVSEALLAARCDANLSYAEGRQLSVSLFREDPATGWGLNWEEALRPRLALSSVVPLSPVAEWNERMLEIGEDTLQEGDELVLINGRDARTSLLAFHETREVQLSFLRSRTAASSPLQLAAVKGLDDLAAALLAAGADPRRADVHPTPAQAFSEAGKVIVEVRDAEAIACAFLVRADARGAVLSDEAASRLGVCRASFVKNGQDITSLRVEEFGHEGSP
ncbi:hypothetical protein AK812_SmicGene33408 [Symbiodinium microadriaticum]|uniref:Uncharacterized protein n=1 Tax=Symbiodinium microadriaticum TaxID=2951 RepID=A0A1Q9CRP5_SYMMI|nr:hypothetical protein AK812_SmicGene33408 [Symbiodinium microadriaticum]